MIVKTVGNTLTKFSKKLKPGRKGGGWGGGGGGREGEGRVKARIEMWFFLNHILVKYYLVLDVDECNTKEQSCDENANWENIPGSYKCMRREGFYGDGIICTGDMLCKN